MLTGAQCSGRLATDQQSLACSGVRARQYGGGDAHGATSRSRTRGCPWLWMWVPHIDLASPICTE
jgi:hypothetical protein